MSCSSAAARAAWFGRGSRAAARIASASAGTSGGSIRTPPSGGTNSGGPPTEVATTGRPQAIASRSAWPNGSTRLGWQRTSRAARSAGTGRAGRAEERHSGAALELPAQRSFAGEVERPVAEPLEGVREADDVLALRQAADAQERRPGGSACRAGSEREALEVDAGVDHLGLAARVGQLGLELARAGSRKRDDGVARRTT